MSLTTLCYIEENGRWLMMHRTRKKNDINKDKWIGIGGHFEPDESPEECMQREAMEETGCTLIAPRLRGIVTFISGSGVTEYMFLYTASGLEGDLIDCDEGELVWIEKEKITSLNLWEGDLIFFHLLDVRQDFFSLKLVYDGGDTLIEAALDGEPLALPYRY
ncbi:MAG: 8-oxo-dGTP diphosphatase [Eubacterium sp.]|nr:8-oxo-dGTP diphosphatase [Eubacterium sp.]